MVHFHYAEKIRYVLSRVRRCMVHSWMYVCRIFPIDKNKVVIMSYYGGGFGDNGKAVALKLREKNPDIKIIWPATLQNRDKLPDFCQYVRFRSMAYYREMATAAVWVDNARKAADIVKRKNQYYIQTWHGTVGLKRIEMDAQNSLSVGYLEDAKNDSRMADLILSGCGFFTKLCRRAFWYEGEIWECGSPRLDTLFHPNEEKNRNIKEQLGIGAEKKVILYAPTFRADGNTDCYIQAYEQILAALQEKTGQDWVFAVRLHPNVADKMGYIHYTENVRNATMIPDLYDLIPIADFVVSDYSSLFFEAAMIQKPVVLYAKDIAEYVADRNFYFNIAELPFPLTHTDQELIDNIARFDKEKYISELEVFKQSIEWHENGTASERVANRILEVLKK